ncbi:MAG: choice-of-anchor P family protein [Actinomycetes bacterium]
MNRRRASLRATPFAFVALVLFAVAGVLIFATPSSRAADQPIGGFSMSGFSAPVSLLIYEPEIPFPTNPQGELHYSFSQVAMDASPFGSTCASSVYPGATLGTTSLKTLNPSLPDAKYPVIACAAYPGGPSHASKTVTAGVGMTADAQQNVTKASASSSESSGDFVSFGNAQSTSTLTNADTQVTGSSVATDSDVGILGGIIQIKSIHGESNATSDGQKAGFSGAQTVTGLSVAGQKFTVDQKGVHPPGAVKIPGIPLPGLPATGTQLLQTLGISFSTPATQTSVQGGAAKMAGTALVVSIDTATYLNAVRNVAATPGLQQLLALTPNPCFDQLQQSPTGTCLHDQYAAILALSPKIVLVFCNTNIQASAVGKFVFNVPLPPLPPLTTPTGTTTPPVTTGTPGLASTGTPGTPGTPTAPTVAPPLNLVSKQYPDGYKGLGALALLGAIVTAGVGYFVRNAGLGVVTGALVGCELGAPGGVPNLRRG